MAQVFVPENPREREQLQGGVSVSDREQRPQRRPYTPRRFGTIDLIVILVVVATVSLLVLAVARWATPLTPAVTIDLSPTALPAYAGYSLLRMILGYLLSLAFTLIYGQIAATRRRAETVMMPLLDILQSIPILSFLPTVILLLVAAFPHSNVGLELSSVIFIFTSMAWNMTFSFYHSARTLPSDLQEVATIMRLRPWQRFIRLVVPASMIGLIWNSMIVMVTHNIDEAVSMADRILVLGANPGRIRVELPGLPREQRTIQSPKHTEMVDLIYRIMTSPNEDMTSLLAQSVPEARTGPLVQPTTRPYQVLPHVAISDVTGLVEFVLTRGGREDLYQLGRHLNQEVDDLLPLVEAADILGLADTQEGDLVLTPEGQHFAEAGVLEEKQVFRDQALAHIALLRQIVRSLEAAPGHTLPEEYFLSLMEEHFDEDEAQEQLETAINWGRYAELFAFQDDRGVFRLEEPEPAETA